MTAYPPIIFAQSAAPGMVGGNEGYTSDWGVIGSLLWDLCFCLEAELFVIFGCRTGDVALIN